MSLINEALKKAQRLRNNPQAQADTAPLPTGSDGIRIAKRRQARSANTMVLLGAGAVALVVLSVVATVYLLNRPSPPPVPAEPSRPAEIASGDAPAPTPIVSAPEVTTPPPATVTPVAVAPAGSATPPTTGATTPTASGIDPASTGATTPNETSANPPSQQPPTSVAVTPAPIPGTSATPTPAAPAATLEEPKPDERVIAFIDAIHVAGIRSSGLESRVLMNDRFYRVNDIVERTLGVRLVKVALDSLTFADANGVTYVKHF